MKLENKDKSMFFSNTEIPDVFFTEYMSEASGDYIKVYLCLVFLTKYDKDIKINDLSKKLNVPLQVIQSALSYWEEKGILTKKPNGYILNNLQEIELHKLYTPNLTLSKEDIKKNEDSKYRAKAIECINNMYFQGVMSPGWYSDIDLWFKKYEFDEQVMISLFDYCFNKSALHKNYVKAVADAWNKSGIKTYEELEIYSQKSEKLNKIKKDIAKKLGRYSSLTQFEEAYIEKWIVDYNYDMKVINIALKKTTSKANPSFDYLDKLISDWHDRKLKNETDVNNFLSEIKQKKKNIKELEKKTNYNNYEQRNYDNLNDLYANKKVN
ncbi:MAG: DnaD domain protein [Mycoplasmataceae bacterium]|nr:DnaD domain protein [Mycoplasmataceae bacterium]